MKIKCDQCGANYQVADEKVRHKVFNIRCKRCDKAIIVRAVSAGEGTEERPSSEKLDHQIANSQGPTAGAQPFDDEATRQVERNAILGQEEAPIWHIVVDRKQVGPLTAEDIAGYLGRGEVDADAFVWCDGLGDWQKLSGVAQFSHLFEGSTQAEKAGHVDSAERDGPDQASDDGEQQSESDGGPVFPRAAADEDVVMSGPDASESDGLFAQADAGASVDPRVDSDSLREQRNENSVLFSLDALDAGSSRPQISNTGGSDGSGLIDISVLGGMGADSAGEEAFDNAGAPEGLSAVAAPQQMASLVTRRRTNTGLVVAMAVGALILAGAVGTAVYFATKSQKQDMPKQASTQVKAKPIASKVTQIGTPKTQKPAVEKKVEAPKLAAQQGTNTGGAQSPESNGAAGGEKAADGVSQKPSAVDGNQSGDKTAAADPVPEKGVAKAKPVKKKYTKAQVRKWNAANAKKKAARKAARAKAAKAKARSKASAVAIPVAKPKPVARAKKQKGGDEVDDLLGALNGNPKPRAKAPSGGGRGAAPAPAADPLLPQKLGRRQILPVVSRNSRRILACRSTGGDDLRGIVKVSITIAGSTGRVSRTRIKTPKFEGTPVGRCVEKAIKRHFRFSQFRDSSMSVTTPFRL
jgi:predicted Zn finger-like uncharacterized protein